MPDPNDPDDPNPPREILPPSPTPYPTLSKFGPDSIDRAVNGILKDAIPGRERSALIDIELKSGDEKLILSGVLAANLGPRWGLVDLGGAIGGAINAKDRRDWKVGVHIQGSW